MHVALLSSFLAIAALPPELGDVDWRRDFAAAQAEARAENKPLLVLFDEVPGCQTCVRYGQSALRHPLLVEAAETLFIPAAVYNNVGGSDRSVLQRFGEPTWNNPVVRVMDADGKALAPRLAGDYRPAALAARMIEGLKASGRPAPRWLSAVADEIVPRDRLHVGMHCFWTGEACLGDLEAVVATRTGWMGGTEVVELDVRAGQGPDVVQAVKARGCGTVVFSTDAKVLRAAERSGLRAAKPGRFRATPSDDLHALGATPWRALPLTELQGSRVNALVSQRKDPSSWLSPRQRELAGAVGKARRAPLPDARSAPDLAAAVVNLEAALARGPKSR